MIANGVFLTDTQTSKVWFLVKSHSDGAAFPVACFIMIYNALIATDRKSVLHYYLANLFT